MSRARRPSCLFQTIFAFGLSAILSTPCLAQVPVLSSADSLLAREIFAELIEIPSQLAGDEARR